MCLLQDISHYKRTVVYIRVSLCELNLFSSTCMSELYRMVHALAAATLKDNILLPCSIVASSHVNLADLINELSESNIIT